MDRALEVYGAMLRLDPGNERVRRRLHELSTEAARVPIPPPVAGARAGSGAAQAAASEPAAPGPAATAPAESRLAIGRLERWLQAVRGGDERAGGEKAR